MKRVGLSTIGALLVALCLLTTACGFDTPVTSSVPNQASQTLTVNASAEVKVVPDKACFTVEVLVSGKTAQEAENAAKDPVDKVITALKAAGVDEKGMQTTYSGVTPTYDWNADSDKERITGYESRTVIEVSEVDVSEVATMMQACLDAGATSVHGPTFAASVYDEAYQEALTKAIAASRTKATTMAEAADVSLGPVVSMVEGYENTAYRTQGASMEKTDVAYDESGGVTIMPGEVTIQAEVTVTYAIG